jgi:hypothetical protein
MQPLRLAIRTACATGLVAVLFGALAPAASAQVVYVPGTNGGPGDVVGTNGPDNIDSSAYPGPDHVFDCNWGSDGVRDNINTADGEDDTIFCGPEDCLNADPDDVIIIRSKAGRLLWKGTFAEYLQMKKLVDRLRRLLVPLIPTLGAPTAIQVVRAEHEQLVQHYQDTPGEVDLVEEFDAKMLEPLEDLSVFEEEIPELALWFPVPESGSEGDDSDDASSTVLPAETLAGMCEGIVNLLDEIKVEA